MAEVRKGSTNGQYVLRASDFVDTRSIEAQPESASARREGVANLGVPCILHKNAVCDVKGGQNLFACLMLIQGNATWQISIFSTMGIPLKSFNSSNRLELPCLLLVL